MASRDPSLELLRAVAPGTPLRNAIELILRQETGALIVHGYGRDVEAICSGGFHVPGCKRDQSTPSWRRWTVR